MTELTRREFSRLAALAAGALLIGPEAFAKTAEAMPTSFKLREPLPINDGPAPLWEEFQYVIHGPGMWPSDKGVWTAAWKGNWQSHQYGDWIRIDSPYERPVLDDALILLKEQADLVRHDLIVNASLPCFCTLCKARSSMKIEELQVKSSYRSMFAVPKSWAQVQTLLISTLDKQYEAYNDLLRQVMAFKGPTNGY